MISSKPDTKGFLYPEQEEVIPMIRCGKILNGGVGSGKSRTSLYWYFIENGGFISKEEYKPMVNPRPLLIITTAKKRDTKEWELECAAYRIPTELITVDSWNNIKKYADISGAYVLFDEDRITGNGVWSKTFLRIAKHNQWIVLSATPGDNYEQYLTIFLANGFYRNRTEFYDKHVVFNPHVQFRLIQKWLDVDILEEHRKSLLINMDVARHTVRHYVDIPVSYDVEQYKFIEKERWDIYNDKPLQQASTLCYTLRKLVNSDKSREEKLHEILQNKNSAIIFYSYDYELEQLHKTFDGSEYEVAEWNGHKHQPIPEGRGKKKWVYLVNYFSGAEGWNCITTDTIIFWSQTYSYKTYEQCCGRIDRVNTKFTDLYYYNLVSSSGIDRLIKKALSTKRDFNILKWEKEHSF